MIPTPGPSLGAIGQMVLTLILLLWVVVNYYLTNREWITALWNRYWIRRQRRDLVNRLTIARHNLLRKEYQRNVRLFHKER